MDEKIVVFVYAEHTVRAGDRRWVGIDEDADELRCDDDLVCYDLTRGQMDTLARQLFASAAHIGAGEDIYRRKVARVLCDAADND